MSHDIAHDSLTDPNPDNSPGSGGRAPDRSVEPEMLNTSGEGTRPLRDRPSDGSQAPAGIRHASPIPDRPPNELDTGIPRNDTDLDLDFGFGSYRIPSRHSIDAEDFNINDSGRIPEQLDYDKETGLLNQTGTKTTDDLQNGSAPTGTPHIADTSDIWNDEHLHRSASNEDDGFELSQIPEHHSDASDDDFGFGNFAVPDRHSDAANNSQISIGIDNDPWTDVSNESRRDPFDGVWDQPMEENEDALHRLLEDRAEDGHRVRNNNNGSFFDEDDAYHRLLDDLIPIAPAPVAANQEPRLLNGEELRLHLPEHQEIYKLAAYFDEAIHIALPYDPEFDCHCEDHGITAISHERRKRAASEPLPGPPKRSCPRVPDLSWLTLTSAPPKTCYLEGFIPENIPAPQVSSPETSLLNRLSSTSSTSTAMDISAFDTLPLVPSIAGNDRLSSTQRSTNTTITRGSLSGHSVQNSSLPRNISIEASFTPSGSSISNTSLLNTAKSISMISVDDLDTVRDDSDLQTARSASTVSLDLETARAATPPPQPLPIQMIALVAPTLEADIQAMLDKISNRLEHMGSVKFRRNAQTLDFVSRLQRNRTSLRRFLKEATLGRKDRGTIERAFIKVDRKLRDLFTEISRSAPSK